MQRTVERVERTGGLSQDDYWQAMSELAGITAELLELNKGRRRGRPVR